MAEFWNQKFPHRIHLLFFKCGVLKSGIPRSPCWCWLFRHPARLEAISHGMDGIAIL
jgi:hypothetical protein